MNGMKIPMALIFAVILQAIGLVWYVSKIDSKVEILYTTFEEENQKEVIENQVKMKLDLENIIAEVVELKKVIKKLKSKDQTLISQNKKINKDHKKLFEILLDEGNTDSNRSYSYGD